MMKKPKPPAQRRGNKKWEETRKMITPIFIPTGSHEKGKTKCPKCGHEWVEESEVSGAFILAIIAFILVTPAVLYWVVGFIGGDSSFSDYCASSLENVRHFFSRLFS
jgi:hypothetical protein